MLSAQPVLPELPQIPTAALCDGLAECGYAIVPDLLPTALLQRLAAVCDDLAQAGALHGAGTGRGAVQDARRRGDLIRWLGTGTPDAAEVEFLSRMACLRIMLNRELQLGLHELEAHFAHYPPGTGYARHRDRFRDDDARVVSLVIYLNAEWQPGDGGELRLHLDGRTRDIAPRLGTSVAFLSDRIEHEVLPALRARRSIAGWFRSRASGLPGLKAL